MEVEQQSAISRALNPQASATGFCSKLNSACRWIFAGVKFPFELLRESCVPAWMRQSIPPRFWRFHGWIHVFSAVGLASCIALFLQLCVRVLFLIVRNDQGNAIQEVIQCIIICPCVYPFHQILRQCDVDLLAEPKQLGEEFASLDKEYGTIKREYAKAVKKFRENEEKLHEALRELRIEFVKALTVWRNKSPPWFSDSDEALSIMISFVRQWCNAFEERHISRDLPVKTNSVMTEVQIKDAFKSKYRSESSEQKNAAAKEKEYISALEEDEMYEEVLSPRQSALQFCIDKLEDARLSLYEQDTDPIVQTSEDIDYLTQKEQEGWVLTAVGDHECASLESEFFKDIQKRNVPQQVSFVKAAIQINDRVMSLDSDDAPSVGQVIEVIEQTVKSEQKKERKFKIKFDKDIREVACCSLLWMRDGLEELSASASPTWEDLQKFNVYPCEVLVPYVKGIRWLQFGNGIHEEHPQGDRTNCFPVRWSLGCGKLVILSIEHLIFLLGFCGGWVDLFLELAYRRDVKWLLCHCLILVTITLMLIVYDDLTCLQNMVLELTDTVEEARKKTKEWENEKLSWSPHLHSLSRVWECRTRPRLRIISALANAVGELKCERYAKRAMEEDIIPFIERLDQTFGELKDWFGKLTQEKEQQFQELAESMELPPRAGFSTVQKYITAICKMIPAASLATTLSTVGPTSKESDLNAATNPTTEP